MTLYESRDGRLRLFRGDSRRLHPIVSGSVGVILTSPPYWVRGRGRQAAERYARDLAVGFGREWKRVLAPDGDLWLMIGDRHDGGEWVGMDALVTGWLRRTGWRLQSRGFWVQIRSRERWDSRVNYLLRFRKVGQVVRPKGTTLCWMLPLPRSPAPARTASGTRSRSPWSGPCSTAAGSADPFSIPSPARERSAASPRPLDASGSAWSAIRAWPGSRRAD